MMANRIFQNSSTEKNFKEKGNIMKVDLQFGESYIFRWVANTS